MDPTPPHLLRVCPKHGLVAGRDGRCVICHRNDNKTAKPRSQRTVLVAALVAAALLGGTLVWKGTRGRRHAAPVETAAVVTAPPPPPPPPDEEEPATPHLKTPEEARRTDQQNRSRDVDAAILRVPIKMFVDSRCELCPVARDWMKERGLHWSEADVGADPSALDALKTLTPNPAVPTFDVGGEVLVGFERTRLLGTLRRIAEKKTP